MKRRFLPSIGALTAFESAARHASFTRAAAELNLTQSALSRQIRCLEEQIGIQLFERIRRQVVITAAGSLYLNDVQKVLADLGDATHRVMSFAGPESALNLAVLPTFATRWLVPRLPEFVSQNPDLTINFHTRLSPFDFAQEPFDAAIHFGQPTWPGAIAHKLMSESVAPFCSPDYRRRLSLKGPADLDRAVLLHQSTRPMAWSEWFEMMKTESPRAFQGPRFEHFAMIAQAAASGLGVALLPSFLVEEEVKAGKLEALFEKPLLSDDAYYFVVPEKMASSPHVRLFAAWITRRARAR